MGNTEGQQSGKGGEDKDMMTHEGSGNGLRHLRV
jgi:hypothetical protein